MIKFGFARFGMLRVDPCHRDDARIHQSACLCVCLFGFDERIKAEKRKGSHCVSPCITLFRCNVLIRLSVLGQFLSRSTRKFSARSHLISFHHEIKRSVGVWRDSKFDIRCAQAVRFPVAINYIFSHFHISMCCHWFAPLSLLSFSSYAEKKHSSA